jgi:hypothetical protein
VEVVVLVQVPISKTYEPVSPGYFFIELQAVPTHAGSVASATLVATVVSPSGASMTKTISKTGLLPSNGPVPRVVPSTALLVVIEIGAKEPAAKSGVALLSYNSKP